MILTLGMLWECFARGYVADTRVLRDRIGDADFLGRREQTLRSDRDFVATARQRSDEISKRNADAI